ncbi:unnamed protein product [Diamesa tonsa]
MIEMFNRIQKLIEKEYDNFNDDVLVESPFAQVSHFQGKGLRAVQIALTVESLIIASDKFLFYGDLDVSQFQKVDPETESLELCQIIPLKFVRIKFIRVGLTDKLFMEVCYKKNQKKVWRFEFGGHFLKYFFWNIWMDKIRRLQEEQLGVILEEQDDQQILNIYNGSVYEWSDSERSVELTSNESMTSLEEAFKNSIAPHLEPFDNANDPNRKFAKEEVEGIPSAVLSKYDGLQQKTADFFKPKPVLDGIREEDKYGNTGDQFQFLNNLVVRSFEAISNVVNKIIDAPGKTLQKVLGKAVDVGNNIGGKVVGLA